MRASLRSDWLRRVLSVVALLAAVRSAGSAENLPVVDDVEFQPLASQVKRVADALEMLGQPLQPDEKTRLEHGARFDRRGTGDPDDPKVLDAHCLIGIEINAESRVKAVQGQARPRLVQNGWSVFLVKVHNEAGVTAELVADSPNAAPIYKQSSGRAEPKTHDSTRRHRSALG